LDLAIYLFFSSLSSTAVYYEYRGETTYKVLKTFSFIWTRKYILLVVPGLCSGSWIMDPTCYHSANINNKNYIDPEGIETLVNAAVLKMKKLASRY